MLSWLLSASARFRFLIVAVAVGVMIAGIARLPQVHVDVLPETSQTVVEVQTEALGLSAPEVEALVTVPLEKNLLEGVLGVTNVTSDSIPGLSAIDLHFAPGTNLYQARQLVQERLTNAFVLPTVSKPPVMLQPTSSTSNVMIIGLSSAHLSQVQLSVLARWTIVPQLLGVAGVANVSTFGQADRQLQVLVKPSVLAAHHVTLAQVIASVGNSQLVTPLTFLQGSTPGTGGFLESQNQRLTIRHILPFGSPANLEEVPVAGAGGKLAPLGDLADVVQGHQPLIGAAVVGTGSGLLLVVQKLPSASVPAVTVGIDQAIAELRPGLAGVHFDESLFRPASYLASASSNFRLALIIAAILAILALACLLLDLRLVLVSLLTMALSVLVALAILQSLGYTVNALALLGLLLALSIVVDDASRAARGMQAELGSREADDKPRDLAALVITAYRDFSGSVAGSSALALLCVAPLFFATGLTAAFLRPAVLAFTLAVLASLLVALTASPALAAVVCRTGQGKRTGLALARWVVAGYAAVLRRAVRMRSWALVMTCVAGVAGLVIALPRLHPGPPAFQDRDLVVKWTGPPGMSLPELTRITTRTDRALLALPGVQDVGATLGRAVTSDQAVNANAGRIWVTIRPDADYDRAVVAVTRIVTRTPGMRARVGTYEGASVGDALSEPPRRVVIRVYGPDLGELGQLAGQVRSAITGTAGLRHPSVQLPVEQPGITVAVNLEAARLHGLTPGEIRREAGTLILGLTVGNFFQQDKVFDVTVQAQPGERASLTSIENMLIDAGAGRHVRLGDVATLSVTPEPSDIRHQAMSPYLDVTAALSGRSMADVQGAIARRLAAIRFPLEYHPEIVSGAARGTSRSLFISYLVAALLGLLLICQALLASWRLTLIALAAVVPSAGLAALVALAISPTSLSAAAGVVGVLVIALRLAIGMMARIRARHAANGGELTADLLILAAGESAGPMITSAVVTAVILVPLMVLGNIAGTELTYAAAVVIAVGLVMTAVVSLLVLPAAYLASGPVAAIAPEHDEDLTSEPALVAPSAQPQS